VGSGGGRTKCDGSNQPNRLVLTQPPCRPALFSNSSTELNSAGVGAAALESTRLRIEHRVQLGPVDTEQVADTVVLVDDDYQMLVGVAVGRRAGSSNGENPLCRRSHPHLSGSSIRCGWREDGDHGRYLGEQPLL